MLQEAWLRASRADVSQVHNIAGWLTTVVARVCLNTLRSRGNRREEPLDIQTADPLLGSAAAGSPEQEAEMADSVGVALLVVLDTLSPAGRLAFMLHDLFAVPFEEIAPMLERSPEAMAELIPMDETRRTEFRVSRVFAGRSLDVPALADVDARAAQVLRGDIAQAVHNGKECGEVAADLDPWPQGMTVLQAFSSGRVGDIDEHTEALLSLGLFSPDDLRQRVQDLSYGQRRRIELARLVTDPVDLLLLDEPTNHLSPALVEELEEALTGYQGTVVVVTHDRRMRSRFNGAHLTLRNGHVAEFTTA